jgi:hypothetical protein
MILRLAIMCELPLRKQFPETAVLLASGYSERRMTVPRISVLAKPYNVTDVITALQNELSEKIKSSW